MQFSETIKDIIVKTYKSGHTLKDCAAVFNCTIADVSGVLAERGVERRKRGKIAGSGRQSLIVSDWKSGLKNIKLLAEKHKCTPPSVYNALRNAGVKVRAYDKTVIYDMIEKGYTNKQIATFCHCTPRNVIYHRAVWREKNQGAEE